MEPRIKCDSRPFSIIHIPALLITAILVLFTQNLGASTIVFDFEGFPDGTSLTTQYPGLTFINATVITAGISLNEFEFPPHAGTNVVFDDGGPITILFSTPVLFFGGFFTYLEPITLTALGASGTQVGSATSFFSGNLALSGDPGSTPNEFLAVASGRGICSVTMTGDPGGDSFVMDDITSASAVPEPSLLPLGLIILTGLLALRMSHSYEKIIRYAYACHPRRTRCSVGTYDTSASKACFNAIEFFRYLYIYFS